MSFLSVLSAQTRREYEPFAVNVYDLLKVLVPLAARVGILTAEVSVMVPPPFGFVATCMKLLNEPPVLPEPILLIVALNSVAIFGVATVGETGPAVRSGGAAQLLPFHTSGAVHVLQVGGLFAPFEQDVAVQVGLVCTGVPLLQVRVTLPVLPFVLDTEELLPFVIVE